VVDNRKGNLIIRIDNSQEGRGTCLFISDAKIATKIILHQSRWIEKRLKVLILFKIVVSNAPNLANLPFIAKKIRTGDIKILSICSKMRE